MAIGLQRHSSRKIQAARTVLVSSRAKDKMLCGYGLRPIPGAASLRHRHRQQLAPLAAVKPVELQDTVSALSSNSALGLWLPALAWLPTLCQVLSQHCCRTRRQSPPPSQGLPHLPS